MNLPEVLPPGSVLLDLSLPDKARAISHVAGLLAAAAGVPAETIEAALVAREALGSTGVGGGVGLPHARLHVLRGTHAVFVRLAAPIPFDSIDNQPVDLLCAVVAPDEPNAALLTAVAAVSRVLRDAAKTAALRSSRDAADVRATLLGGGS
jgi:nitrogen PTS system EIIA component